MRPHYIIDDTGQKVAVILPITEYHELLEDLQDLAIIAQRRDEPTLSHEALLAELKQDGLLVE